MIAVTSPAFSHGIATLAKNVEGVIVFILEVGAALVVRMVIMAVVLSALSVFTGRMVLIVYSSNSGRIVIFFGNNGRCPASVIILILKTVTNIEKTSALVILPTAIPISQNTNILVVITIRYFSCKQSSRLLLFYAMTF